MSTLMLDLETFHETVNLRVSGTYRYAVGAEVMLAAWAWDEDLPTVWDFTDATRDVRDLQALIDAADKVVVHNSSFERIVLREQGVDLPLAKIEDTAVIALQHGLVKDLDKLCSILGVPESESKLKEGGKLINLFCSPCPKNWKLRRATRESHPEEWERFKVYAGMDIVSMREVSRRLPRWNCTPQERHYFALDQRINDRGFTVDVELAHAAQAAFQRLVKGLAVRTKELTGGAVGSTTEREKLLGYLQKAGLDVDDVTKDTVERLLSRDDLDPELRELLEIREQASRTTPAKFGALLKAMNDDGRLRGTLQYCGAARTGRDSGRIFQPQNLIRTPDWFDEFVQEITVEVLKSGCEDLLWEDVADRVAFVVRGALIAAEGHQLLAADLSNIEGRALAWLADEEWKIKAFADYDAGTGEEIYKITAGLILGKPASEITKDERQKYGKVSELSLGYQGSVGAVRKMGGAIAEAMSDDEILEIVRPWRARHPRTKNLWYKSEDAARDAVNSPGESFTVGYLTFDCVEDAYGLRWLRMRLPSKRYLCYLRPSTGYYACPICDGSGVVIGQETGRQEACFECKGEGALGDGQFTYEGVDQKTKQWGVRTTYGGSFCIAEGTPVLTQWGWVPIESMTTAHRVWDGAEWVQHEGLAHNGVKEVELAHGVWMTPDHEVLTTEGWRRASQSRGYDRADARLPDAYALCREQWPQVALAGVVRLREHEDHRSYGVPQAAEAQQGDLVRVPAKGDPIAQAAHPWHVEAQGIRSVAQHERPLQAPDASVVEELRRSWNYCVRAVAASLSRLLGRHGADLRGGPHTGAQGQFAGLQSRELYLGGTTQTGAQYPGQPPRRNTVGPSYGRRGIRALWDQVHDAAVQALARRHGHPAFRASRLHAEVYDLVNAGPRKRFTVRGVDGLPLIVHNCENATQAVARDVFFHGLAEAEKAGYPVVLRVHDELVAEAPLSDPTLTVEGLAACMSKLPPWAFGLPLAAEGFTAKRYRKG